MGFVAILDQLCEIATSQNIRSPELKVFKLYFEKLYFISSNIIF